ncbi:type II toxin-antitoxin system HicB family antitoxin [Synechococcus sp. AH-603-L18]|nr:toxin-antitoxin system HicB family antitoxin [Synechococcus sp. AH-603-L18]MDB4337986.1 type II toxin-antitoxin system HicB family antitoxin [Synechococcus sp. AH-603-L18]
MVVVTPDVHARLKVLAAMDQKTMNGFIEQMMNDRIEQDLLIAR